MKDLLWNESIRLYREQYGYSQKELSKKLNISEKTLQRYELGLSEPTITILINLSKIYEISIDKLVNNTNHKNTNFLKLENYIKQIETICINIKKQVNTDDDITLI